MNGRIETQVFHTRCPQPPDVLLFHPFDSHLAVACKDYFG
jgi:regulator-associated protein of mTOR